MSSTPQYLFEQIPPERDISYNLRHAKAYDPITPRTVRFSNTYFQNVLYEWNLLEIVDHDLLCKKLEHYGVQQRELSWFQSYLSNRKQFCRVDGVDSRTGDVEIGVPQGSCLGHFFF